MTLYPLFFMEDLHMGFELTADETVAELTDKGSFNVFDFVAGTVAPEDTITVYTDADAALKLAKIYVAEKERAERDDDLSIGDEDATDEDVVNALTAKLTASALVFSMKGLLPAAVTEVDKDIKSKTPFVEGAPNEEYSELFNNTLIAKSIVSVTSPTGAINTDKWTPKMVKGFLPALYQSESAKLFNTTAELSYVGAIFDRAVNADF